MRYGTGAFHQPPSVCLPGFSFQKQPEKQPGKAFVNVAEQFIRRPVVTILVMLVTLLLGVTSYLFFLRAVEPRNLDSPAILVSANLPGASAAIMEASVATPLERQFVTLAGLNVMTSVNDVGFTEIALEFNTNRNIDTAAQDVQAAITRTLPQLPAGMSKPPSYHKLNRADLALLDLLSTIDKSVETVVAQTGSSVRDSSQA
jgi:hydrophobic/amphiphilic exporter-1 (mainly G- bacteria), HAE1 family